MAAKFKGKLFKHQEEGVRFALSSPYHLNGFEMGLGKTATALATACRLNARTLVVCPAFLRRNWLEEVEKFTEGLEVDIISYTSLAKTAPSGKYDFIIADEAHYLKNHKAKRTGAFHAMIKNMKPGHMMLMSGTPIKNRVSEFWSLLQLIHYGGKYPKFEPFHRLYFKFCNTFSYERSFEVNGFPIVRFDGIKNVPLLKDLINPIYIRRRTKEVLDLPDMMDNFVQSKNSKKFDADLKEAFELFEINPKDAAYMSLKSANALAKVSDTIKLAQDMLEQDEKVIIFSCHRASVKKIAEKFKVKYIDGSVSPDKRHNIISDFNKSGSGVLVATVGAASTGFNITSANKMIFNDYPFVPADLEQAKKRMHRIGQDKKCFYYYIMSSDFDKKLMEMIYRKNRDIGRIYE